MNWKQAFSLGLIAPGEWGGQVVSDGWEVVYDEMVTTERPNSESTKSARTTIYNTDVLIGDALYRLTVDDRFTFEARNVQNDGSVKCFGNIYLWLPNQNQDNGEDFFLLYASVNHNLWYPGGLYSREPGTYHVKVERKKPVAYLYGEDKVRLPDIYKVYTPELQKTYPFAVLHSTEYTGSITYWLWIFDQQPYWIDSTYLGFMSFPDGTEGRGYTYDPEEDSGWPVKTIHGEALYTGERPFWSNFNVLNEDGSVYLEASSPIPVYE